MIREGCLNGAIFSFETTFFLILAISLFDIIKTPTKKLNILLK